MTIVEFLTARLDEDQAEAESVASDWNSVDWDAVSPLSSHIDRWDPPHVLADIASKRAIVARCGREVRQQELNARRYDFDTSERHALRALASVYADHPEYQQEWKP